MQFFLLDLALAFAALLGYRTLAALAGRSDPVVVFGPHPPLRAGAASGLKRKLAQRRGLPPEGGVSRHEGGVSRHGKCCEQRAPLHRLVNLW